MYDCTKDGKERQHVRRDLPASIKEVGRRHARLLREVNAAQTITHAAQPKSGCKSSRVPLSGTPLKYLVDTNAMTLAIHSSSALVIFRVIVT